MPWIVCMHPELLTACTPANVADAVGDLGYTVPAVPWAGPESVRVPLPGLGEARLAELARQLTAAHPQWAAEPEPGGWVRVSACTPPGPAL